MFKALNGQKEIYFNIVTYALMQSCRRRDEFCLNDIKRFYHPKSNKSVVVVDTAVVASDEIGCDKIRISKIG